MNNFYDGEMIVRENKAAAHAAAAAYDLLHRLPQQPAVHVRLMALIGGVFIAVGNRLVARNVYLTATALDYQDSLSLSSNGTSSANC